MDEFIWLAKTDRKDKFHEANKPVEYVKNRYKNVYPYEDTRFKISMKRGVDGVIILMLIISMVIYMCLKTWLL